MYINWIKYILKDNRVQLPEWGGCSLNHLAEECIPVPFSFWSLRNCRNLSDQGKRLGCSLSLTPASILSQTTCFPAGRMPHSTHLVPPWISWRPRAYFLTFCSLKSATPLTQNVGSSTLVPNQPTLLGLPSSSPSKCLGKSAVIGSWAPSNFPRASFLLTRCNY